MWRKEVIAKLHFGRYEKDDGEQGDQMRFLKNRPKLGSI
jgi:hypothetical protein